MSAIDSELAGVRKGMVVVGAGGHGAVVAEAISAGEEFFVLGFLSDSEVDPLCDSFGQRLGRVSELGVMLRDYRIAGVAVAIGDNATRLRVICKLREMLPATVGFPPVIHPRATVCAQSSIGEGSVVLAGAVVGVGATVGRGCIVNTRASLDHHGTMGDYSSLAPGVTCGGKVCIGTGSAISLGAMILHGRTVGTWSVVGAGAVVTRDVPDKVVAYGIPAKVVRERSEDDPYL